MGVSFVCPYCDNPIDPLAPGAMMSAATKQWQHTKCWTREVQSVDSSAPDTNLEPRRKRG